ncbi:MAG: sporulation integral membrane protein YtvI [Pseudoflavonifractor capillosus]|uniref:sporulation integral membrane protein YtvI n=1 Tax=Pseudoflavonifractor capillosus TaxID=106588 RepID=UPI0023F97025|nr:sporulation integral membrane protein YtvI [Pseudoflavonifractor capillosus]MCI5928998.1 sporulation integral membrane protein YtvI [Pseudoflavonifractor capillosus]MDY4660632.1 sporulation integral membrane protein YtvI [Pseudoflavonifractor capillosus]
MNGKELTWRERGRLWLRLGIRLAGTILVLLFLVYGAPPLLGLLMPFVLALVLTWILNPAIVKVQRRFGGSRKALSLVMLILIFTIAGGILAALVYSIVSEVASLVMNWPSIWADSLQPAIVGLEEFLSGLFTGLPNQVSQGATAALDKLVAWLNEMIPSLLSHAGSAVGSFAFSIPSFAVALVIFVMATYFIASDYPRLRLMVTDRLSPGVRDFFGSVKRTAVAAFGGYVKAQLILSVVIFFILLIGFVVIRQPYSVLLAFLLAVLDFIPIVGSGTVIVPWAVADLFLGEYRHAVELMVIWGIIALFRRGAEPKVVGDQTGLSPILSLISIYVGMKIAGVAGMILGPVLCMVAINIGRLGVLDGVLSDLRMAAGDLAAILKNRPALETEREHKDTERHN